MAFIVINRRDKKELRRIADALDRIADALTPVILPGSDDTIEIVSIDRQKKNIPEDEDMPESSRM